METRQSRTYAGEMFVSGSGNVFADLGLSNPEERLAKAQLVHRIAEIIKERRLTQVEAGVILGIDQAKVSKLVRGRLSEFSTSTLMDYLTRLDQDVEIVVRPKPSSRETATLAVMIPSNVKVLNLELQNMNNIFQEIKKTIDIITLFETRKNALEKELNFFKKEINDMLHIGALLRLNHEVMYLCVDTYSLYQGISQKKVSLFTDQK